jgi:hypothetical protein
VDRAREGEGPSFVEARTYRLCGHHMGDIGFGRVSWPKILIRHEASRSG